MNRRRGTKEGKQDIVRVNNIVIRSFFKFEEGAGKRGEQEREREGVQVDGVLSE